MLMIQEIPGNFDPNKEGLVIEKNYIQEIRPSFFESYKKLVNLSLSENNISTIQDNTFEAQRQKQDFRICWQS